MVKVRKSLGKQDSLEVKAMEHDYTIRYQVNVKRRKDEPITPSPNPQALTQI